MSVRYERLTFDRPGHATVRIESPDATVIYIDPWSEVLDGTPGDADIVFSTHDDFDHFDPAGIAAVSNEDTIVVIYEAIDAGPLDRDVIRLGTDAQREVAGLTVQSVPAYNHPDGNHVRSNGEPYHPETTVIGLVLTIDGSRVYYCSDTDALEELAGIDADVVIPPIGGRPTMDRHEAAELVSSIGPDLVLPVHYNSDVIDGIDADAAAFKEAVEAMGIRVELF
ncbi:MAG: MBL fold metallo-hydrolase [Salinirussus sp.]